MILYTPCLTNHTNLKEEKVEDENDAEDIVGCDRPITVFTYTASPGVEITNEIDVKRSINIWTVYEVRHS